MYIYLYKGILIIPLYISGITKVLVPNIFLIRLDFII